MSAWSEHFRQLARTRMPFLPLLACAVGGILWGQFFPTISEALVLVAPAALGLAAWLAGKRSGLWLLCLGTALAFAAMHAWRAHGSVARLVADTFPGPVVAEIGGVVAGVPREFDEDRSAFRVEVHRLALPTWSGDIRFPIQLEWRGPPPFVGDHIVARGSLSSFPHPRNPGEFDLKAWMQSKGLFSSLRVNSPSDTAIEKKGFRFSPAAVAGEARLWTQRTLTAGLDPDSRQAHLILGMTLGDTQQMDEALLEGFRGTGTFHLFSVSGLHVGMLGILLWLVLAALGVPRHVMVALIIPALFFYALVTGWKPASVRASVMASFVLVGLVSGRPPVVFNSLLAAAFFILMANSLELFNPGFQLSFSVVAMLVLICGPLNASLSQILRPDPFLPIQIQTPMERLRQETARKVAPLAAVAVAAWVGSLPLTLTYFHLISFSAIPANMVCVPLAFCVMAVAMLSLIGGLAAQAVAAIFNNANWLLATVLLGIVETFASLPGSYFYLPPLALHPPVASVTVFDFGKGGSIAVEASGKTWLIDCGSARDHDRTLLPFLRSRGLNKLDALILTHGDATHIAGGKGLLSSCPPSAVYENILDDRSPVRRNLQETMQKLNLPVHSLAAGDALQIAPGVTLDILFPPRGYEAGLADDKCLVLLLQINGNRVLLLSDAGAATESWLLENAAGNVPCDIIVKGSHRSRVAMNPALLDAAGPAVLVSSGEVFASGERLPHETEKDAGLREIIVYRQEQTGAVSMHFHPSGIKFEPFLIRPGRDQGFPPPVAR